MSILRALEIGSLVLALSACGNDSWKVVGKHHEPSREVPEVSIIPVEPFPSYRTGRMLRIEEQNIITLRRMGSFNVKGIPCPYISTEELVVDKDTYDSLIVGDEYRDP